MRVTALFLAVCLPLCLASACADGGKANPTDPTPTDPADPADPVDPADPIDITDPTDPVVPVDPIDPVGPIGPGEPNYPTHCTQTGYRPFQQQFGQISSGVTAYQASNRDREPFDLVAIEFYGGDFGGATGPGTYGLDDSNYETCGNCVLIRTGCSASGGCARTFYADVGQVVITSWAPGDLFKGYLDGVVLREVTIDPSTYRSTPVPGGEVWCLDQHPFEAPVAAPIVGGGDTQPTCVAGGTGTLVHDNIADFSLPNCLGEDVSLHATCGETKALWIVGTAGWCGACHELLGQIVAQHAAPGELLTRTQVGLVTPGLDVLVVLAENQFGAKPSPAYCKAYAEGLGIDPSMVVIDHSTTAAPIPLIDPEGYMLPVNSFATLWTHMNPYLVADGDGVVTATPWNALLRGSNMEYMWSNDTNNGFFEVVLGTLLGE